MTTLSIRLTISLSMLLASTGSWAQHTGHTSPYREESDQAIKTLSAQDVTGYMNGRGMGLAKAAELNGYPGPMHVLEAEKELGLTPGQKANMQVAYEIMHGRAVKLGKQIVEQETILNQLFTSEKATSETLQATVDTLARLQRALRVTHLDAHLKAKQILTVEQVNQYNKLRGYTK